MLPGQLVALSNTHTQGLQYMVCGYMYVCITNAAKMVDTQYIYGHCLRYVIWHMRTCNLHNNLMYSLLYIRVDQATFCRMMKIGF